MAYPQDISIEEPFVQGTLWKPLFTVLDADKSAVDLTTANTEAWLVLRKQGQTATTYTRSTATAAQRSYETDGTNGQVRFIFKASDTLNIAAGEYDAELFWKNSSTDPKQQLPKGRGVWFVEAPSTGTLSAP